MNSKGIISDVLVGSVQDGDVNGFVGFSVLKDNGALVVDVIDAWSCSVFSFIKLKGFVINSKFSIAAILSQNHNFKVGLGSDSSDSSLLFV